MPEAVLAPFRQHITLFKDIAAAAAATHQRHDWWPCRRGCSECCHHPFAIAESEWRLTQLGLALLPPEQRQAIRARARRHRQIVRAAAHTGRDWRDLRLPCPFLDEAGACQVYDVRPALCRMFGYGMFRPTGRPEEPYQSAVCRIIKAELDARTARGEGVELQDLTVIRQRMRAIELGEKKPIAEWLAEEEGQA